MGAAGGEESTLAIATYLLCAAVFTILMFYSLFRATEPLAKVQVSPLPTRLYWCVKTNVYICFMSAVLHIMHVTNFEELIGSAVGGPNTLIIKPVEYMLTCPVMMLSLVVLGGEAVPPRRQIEAMGLTCCVLLCGTFASSVPEPRMKIMLFSAGCCFFAALLQRISASVWEHSGGTEQLFCGFHGSVYKHFCMKIVLTWVLFPSWWLVSNEGLGVVRDKSTNLLVTAALNITAKGIYVLYMQVIHDQYIGSESLLEHPTHRDAAERDAQFQVGRLGAAGAIQALEKSIANEKQSIRYIKTMRNVVSSSSEFDEDDFEGSEFGMPPSTSGGVAPVRKSLRARTSASCGGASVASDHWRDLALLVTQVCSQQGADDHAGVLLKAFKQGHVLTTATLAQLSSSDLEALSVPVGLRQWLLHAAKFAERTKRGAGVADAASGKQECADTEVPCGSETASSITSASLRPLTPVSRKHIAGEQQLLHIVPEAPLPAPLPALPGGLAPPLQLDETDHVRAAALAAASRACAGG